MQTEQFNFDLPPELIAQRPPPYRGDARLLILDGVTGSFTDGMIDNILRLVEPGDLLVFNDTQVMPARLFGVKESGGKIELLIERILDSGEILAHIKASKAPRGGSNIIVGKCFRFSIIGRKGGLFRLANESPSSITEIMQSCGQIPLPPYIERAADAGDFERYQTVYARAPGAVAAPTAGLHFDETLLASLEASGVDIGFITLHVGAGTFQPVRSTDLKSHTMHTEHYEISPRLCRQVAQAKSAGKRVIAIGTTSVRALESAASVGEIEPLVGETDIFIYPGFRFRVVDAMLTNFHLPSSTLLMLVCAFAGRENILAAYAHAVKSRYRFFSYGDAMWITPGPAANFEQAPL